MWVFDERLWRAMQNPYRRAFLLSSLGIKPEETVYVESLIDAIDIHGTVSNNMWLSWFDAHRKKGQPKNKRINTIFPGRKKQKSKPEGKYIEMRGLDGKVRRMRITNWQDSSE